MKDSFEFLFSHFSFPAAEAYFDEKMPVTKDAFKKMSTKYKKGAFTVAGYTKAEVINEFHQTLLKAIEEGSTLENFKDSMGTFLEDKGYEGMTALAADNIFRTNIQTAYQVGHYEEMNKDEVKKIRPYWMYDAVADSRTRPSHMAMNGKVFPADSPVWDTWYPPNGFRCRCTVVTLSRRQVEARGLKVLEDAPSTVKVKGREVDVYPDPDFDYNPAKKEFRPEMSNFPESIKKAYYKNRNGSKKTDS